jgi:hypothetical protein
MDLYHIITNKFYKFINKNREEIILTQRSINKMALNRFWALKLKKNQNTFNLQLIILNIISFKKNDYMYQNCFYFYQI